MKKLISAFTVIILIFCLCACEALFIKKDTLIPIIDDTGSDQNGFLTIKVNSYTDVTNAVLLNYDKKIDSGIFVYKDSLTPTPTSSLYLFSEEGEKLLFSGQNTYTYAEIDATNNTVYFKEVNSKDMSVSLYKTDFDASYKTKLFESTSNVPIICDSDNGKTIYVDKDNNLIKTDGDISENIYSFSPTSAVKKVTYYDKEGLIIALVTISAKSNILYTINASTGALVAIDAGVSEFEFSENNKMLYYIKSAGDTDQIYSYSLNTFRSYFLYSASVSDIAVSPHGSYIAFSTKAKDEGALPSIWMLTTSTNEATQLTAYTPLYGDIYFISSNEIMFTTVETNEQSTITTLKKLEFETVYSEEGSSL